MKQIDYIEDDHGNMTKVLMSDEPFNTLHLKSSDKPKLYALELTDEMVDCITQGWEA